MRLKWWPSVCRKFLGLHCKQLQLHPRKLRRFVPRVYNHRLRALRECRDSFLELPMAQGVLTSLERSRFRFRTRLHWLATMVDPVPGEGRVWLHKPRELLEYPLLLHQ